jgi:tellurite resistance protein TehA-like permease
MSTSTKPASERPDDPSLIRSRREAFMILGLWAACFVYTATYCYLFGYSSHEPLKASVSTGPDIAVVVGPLESFNRDPASITYPFDLGIPDWVLWGIVTPWAICIVLSLIFCLFIYTDEDLGVELEAGKPQES